MEILDVRKKSLLNQNRKSQSKSQVVPKKMKAIVGIMLAAALYMVPAQDAVEFERVSNSTSTSSGLRGGETRREEMKEQLEAQKIEAAIEQQDAILHRGQEPLPYGEPEWLVNLGLIIACLVSASMMAMVTMSLAEVFPTFGVLIDAVLIDALMR